MAKCFFCNKAEAVKEVENKVGAKVEACWEHYTLALSIGWKEAGNTEIPTVLPEMDFGELVKMCQSYINELDSFGYVDDDLDHYIFEQAMECVFGKGVFDWVNSVFGKE